MKQFDHEKLDVYKTSLEFVKLAYEIVEKFPKGYSYLSDQMSRASTSITLNIAEGAGEFSSNEKARFYRMARRSATECAGIIDICDCANIIDENNLIEGKELLVRIVSMLTKMVIKK